VGFFDTTEQSLKKKQQSKKSREELADLGFQLTGSE